MHKVHLSTSQRHGNAVCVIPLKRLDLLGHGWCIVVVRLSRLNVFPFVPCIYHIIPWQLAAAYRSHDKQALSKPCSSLSIHAFVPGLPVTNSTRIQQTSLSHYAAVLFFVRMEGAKPVQPPPIKGHVCSVTGYVPVRSDNSEIFADILSAFVPFLQERGATARRSWVNNTLFIELACGKAVVFYIMVQSPDVNRRVQPVV